MQRKTSLYDVHIGGMFACPMEENLKKLDSTKAKYSLGKLLKKANVITDVDTLAEEDGSNSEKRLNNAVIVHYVENEEEAITYIWNEPLIFNLKIKKGFGFTNLYDREEKTEDPINAIVAYNGVWFMSLVDIGQFSDTYGRWRSGPNIRDILETLMKKKNKWLIPISIPPSVIPKRIGVKIEKIKGKKAYVKYLNSQKMEDELLLSYEKGGSKISDNDLRKIIIDIYYNIVGKMDTFYYLAHDSLVENDKRNKLTEQYEEMCKGLKNYVEISSWRVLKRNRVAGKLSKKLSNIQVDLVSNRLSQINVIKKSEEIVKWVDSRGILEYLKDYCKGCIIDGLDIGAIEYEGLKGTLSHVESLLSQHNTIVLGVVAVVAGLLGVVIGAMIS